MVLDLLFILILATISAALGLRVLTGLNELPENSSDQLALALPIGLGAISLGVLFLGQIEVIQTSAIVVLLCAFFGLGLGPLRKWFRGWKSSISTLNGPTFFDALLVTVLLGTMLTALTPVTDGDALCYHLQVPKIFLESGSVGFDADLHETIYPLLNEFLYLVALAFRGPIACRLVQWLLGIVFALNVNAMARPILGQHARWAGTIALCVPAVSNGMGAPLNDVALAAFGNAALFAWTRWHDRPNLRTATLTGVLTGLALGVKYPAIVLTALIGVAMFLDCLLASRRRDKAADESASWAIRQVKDRFYIDPKDVLAFDYRKPVAADAVNPYTQQLRQVIVFGLVAVLVGCAWYVRAYQYTGNPVFPFFRHLFGGAGLDEVLDPIKRPMEVTAWNLVTALIPMTLDPARFDSVSHQFGPLFLLALPAMLLERPGRRVWALVGMGYLFMTICLSQRQSMRFVLIAVGPMSIGVAWLIHHWWSRRTVPSRAIVMLMMSLLCFEASLAVMRSRHGLSVVLGQESVDAYLTRREPTYRVGQWIENNLSPKARLVGQDHRGYYIPRSYAMELAHRRRTGLGTHGETPQAIADALRNDGFTHILLCPPQPENAVEFDPTLSHKLAPWLKRQKPIYEESITDPDGVTRRYSIYSLGDSDVSILTGRNLSK